jgi:tape measure domain-containing protein
VVTRTLKLNIDARQAKEGAKQFASSIKAVSLAVGNLDTKVTATFKKINTASSSGFSALATSLGKLSGVKLPATLTTSLGKLNTALNGFTIPTAKKVADLDYFFDTLREAKLPETDYKKITTLKGALKKFTAPQQNTSKNLGTFFTNMKKGVGLPQGDFKKITSLKNAVKDFKAPAKAQSNNLGLFFEKLKKVTMPKGKFDAVMRLSKGIKDFKAPGKSQVTNLASFTKALKDFKIPRRDFSKLGPLAEAFKGFKAPTQKQTNNFINFTNALHRIKLPPNMGQISYHMDRMSRSAIRVSASVRGMSRRLDTSGRAARRAGSRYSRATGAMRGLENSFDGTFQAASLLRRFLGVFTFARFTQSVFEATTAYLRFLNLFDAVGKSIGKKLDGVAQYKELVQVTNKLGGSLEVALDEFGKFSAAALNTGLSMDDTMRTYKALTGASTVLGLSTERTRLSFLAVTQMLSKGRVSTEELRRQLGEQIPGLFESFSREIKKLARDAGVEIDSLDDALRKGLVSGKGGVLVLEKILREQYGDQVAKALERADRQLQLLKNTMFDLRVEIGQADFMSTLSLAFAQINKQLSRADFKKLAEDIGQALANGVLRAADALRWLLDNMNLVIGAMKVFAAIITVGAFKRFAMAIASMVAPMVQLIAFFGRAAGAFTVLGVSSATAGVGVSRLGFAIKTLMMGTGIGALILGVSALVTIMQAGRERTREMKDGLLALNDVEITFGQKTAAAFDVIIEKAGEAINVVGELFRQLNQAPSGEDSFFTKFVRSITAGPKAVDKLAGQGVGAVAFSTDSIAVGIKQYEVAQKKIAIKAKKEGGIYPKEALAKDIENLAEAQKELRALIAYRDSRGAGFAENGLYGNAVAGLSGTAGRVGESLAERVRREAREAQQAALFDRKAKESGMPGISGVGGAASRGGVIPELITEAERTAKQAAALAMTLEGGIVPKDIDPDDVFGVSLKNLKSFSSEIAGIVSGILPAEGAYAKAAAAAAKLGDAERRGLGIIERRIKSRAAYKLELEKTVESEEDRNKLLEQFDAGMVTVQKALDAIPESYRKIAAEAIKANTVGAEGFFKITDSMERLTKIQKTLSTTDILTDAQLRSLGVAAKDFGKVRSALKHTVEEAERLEKLKLDQLLTPGMDSVNKLKELNSDLEAKHKLLGDILALKTAEQMLDAGMDPAKVTMEVQRLRREIAGIESSRITTAFGPSAQEFAERQKRIKQLAIDQKTLAGGIQGKDFQNLLSQAFPEGATPEQSTNLFESIGKSVREGGMETETATFGEAFESQLDNMLSRTRNWAQEVGTVMGGAFQSLTTGLGDAFGKIMVEGADAKEVFKSLAQTIARDVVNSLAQIGVQMMMNAIMGRTQAKLTAQAEVANQAAVIPGAATQAGLVSAGSFGANIGPAMIGMMALMALMASFTLFAKGGVVNSPTMFQHNAGMGLMGEAGPEAIMPLQRDKQGRLGVSGGGGSVTNQWSITIDASGAEQGVEEKMREVLIASMPMIVNLTTQASKNEMANQFNRSRL